MVAINRKGKQHSQTHHGTEAAPAAAAGTAQQNRGRPLAAAGTGEQDLSPVFV